jgi:hypothetical protein
MSEPDQEILIHKMGHDAGRKAVQAHIALCASAYVLALNDAIVKSI